MKMGEPVGQHQKKVLRREYQILTGNFASNCMIRIFESVRLLDHSDTLASSSLTSLNHNRVTDLPSRSQSRFDTCHTCVHIRLVRNDDVPTLRKCCIRNPCSRPRHSRYIGTLRDNGTRNLVSQAPHSTSWRTNENNLVLASSQTLG